VAVSLKYLSTVMTPVVWFIELFSKGHHGDAAFNRDELKVMAEMGLRQGKLNEDESRILDNLLQLRDISVHEVMTPRSVVFALSKDLTVKEYVDEHEDSPFSRVPIFGENRDDVKGFVLKHDILLAAARNRPDQTLEELNREIPVLPHSTRLSNAFQTLVSGRYHIAAVVDEYGGLSGLVTMEDVVETLLGLEIVDEADTREDMQEFARSLWKKRATKMGIGSEPSSELGVEESGDGGSKKDKDQAAAEG
jgi:CBS domain containing-hemolysin-like protein